MKDVSALPAPAASRAAALHLHATKGGPSPFSPGCPEKNGPDMPHSRTDADVGSGTNEYTVGWAETENLFKSKYTKDLTDRHSAVITKICRQYMAHYGGIPYTDLPNLTPLVQHVVTGFQQGKPEYGLALRALCTIASKPFIARKVSEPLTYKDEVVLFVITLCQAAAYKSTEPAASLLTDNTGEEATLRDASIPNDVLPASAALAGDLRQEIIDIPGERNPKVGANNVAHSADELGIGSSCSSMTSSGALVKSGDACEDSANVEKHAEVRERHTPSPSAESTFRSLNDDTHGLTQTPRTTAVSITASENERQNSTVTGSDDGSPAGDKVSTSVREQAWVPENNGTASHVSGEEKQAKQQKSSASTCHPEGESLVQANQSEEDAVRIAVFDLLRSLISQWTTSRRVSTNSGTKLARKTEGVAAPARNELSGVHATERR